MNQHQQLQNPHCPSCGYDRSNLALGHPCPECGYPRTKHSIHKDATTGFISEKHSVTQEPTLQNQHRKCSIPLNRTGHSVQDELAIFPKGMARGIDLIDRDYSCDVCSTNLKGLRIGQKCPNCGKLIVSGPDKLNDKTGIASQGQLIKQGIENTSIGFSAVISCLAILVSGPAAVLGTFLKASGGLSGITIIGPAVEEMMKIIVIALIIEHRPYWIKHRLQILATALASGFGFAAIENLLYLNIYIENPSDAIVVWRWTVCVLLHTGCSVIAAIGLMKLWCRSIKEYRRIRLYQAFPWLAGAAITHGIYNAAAVMMSWTNIF